MKIAYTAALAAAALYAPLRADAGLILIDPFTATQAALQVIGSPAGPRNVSGALDTGTVIGGEREVRVERTSLAPNAGQTSVDVNLSIEEAATFASGPNTAGRAIFTYDGDDSISTLNTTGLGGLNLTTGGIGEFRVRATSDLGGVGILDVYTNAGLVSRRTFNLAPDPTFTFVDYVLPYSSFVDLVGTGADFANVGAIRFTVDGTSVAGTDVGIDFIAAGSPVPEPAAFLLFGSGLAAVALRMRRR